MLETDASPHQYYAWNRWGRVGEERTASATLQPVRQAKQRSSPSHQRGPVSRRQTAVTQIEQPAIFTRDERSRPLKSKSISCGGGLVAIWWRFGGDLAAAWSQFGGGVAAVLLWHRSGVALPEPRLQVARSSLRARGGRVAMDMLNHDGSLV